MRCPHCNVAFNEDFYESYIESSDNDSADGYVIKYQRCPECDNLIIVLSKANVIGYFGQSSYEYSAGEIVWEKTIYPIGKNLTVSNEIPEKYSKELVEAKSVLDISPKASATLSRRLLQMVLENECDTKAENLEKEIEKFQTKAGAPGDLIKLLNVLRKVANFGAHPKKSTNTGEIVEIEKGEADLLITILEKLLDYVFVAPAELQKSLSSIEDKYGFKIGE